MMKDDAIVDQVDLDHDVEDLVPVVDLLVENNTVAGMRDQERKKAGRLIARWGMLIQLIKPKQINRMVDRLQPNLRWSLLGVKTFIPVSRAKINLIANLK